MADVELTGPANPSGALVELPAITGDDVPRTRVLLNDQHALAIEGSLRWGYVSGVEPQTAVITVMKEHADQLLKAIKSTVKLTGEAADGRLESVPVTFENLWLNLRSPVSFVKDGLLLQDDRWWWSRPKVTKAYNLTRRSNDLLTFRGNVPGFLENALVEAVPYFVENTILADDQGGLRPYTALDIVFEILTDVLGYDPGDVQIADAAPTNYVPQNQFIQGESASSVISRFLALGGNDLYIERDGTVVIYDRTEKFDLIDFRTVFKGGKPGLRSGDLFVVDYAAVRPNTITVQHPVEAELLCTFEEVGETDTTNNLPADNFADALRQIREGRVFLKNVTRTKVPNQVRDLPRGSVVDIADAITAYGELIDAPRALTLDDFREVYGDDNAEMLGAFSASAATVQYVVNAVQVFQEINRDFRSLFQLPDPVRKQLLGMKALLVDILNEESQTRSPSEVFSILSWVVSDAYLFALTENNDGTVLDSFSERPYVPVPAKVTIEDFDLGLIRVDWLGDLDRVGAIVKSFPGEALNPEFYNDELGAGRAVAGQASYHHGVKVPWECSFIISVVPFPNNDPNGTRLFRQSFSAEELVGVEGKGPKLTHYAGSEAARFRLNDFLQDYLSGDRRLRGTDVEVDADLKTEMGVSGPMVNAEVISAIGRAEALRIMRTFNNQLEGQAVFAWDGFFVNLKPRASLRNITFSFSATGEATVTCQAQRVTAPRDLQNVLPRRVLEATGQVLRFSNLEGG